MKILVFGSLNIDYTYEVDHFVAAGETLASDGLNEFVGGKGLNQAVALARAGGEVYHAGCIGKDGVHLLEYLNNAGVHTEYVHVSEKERTGHAIIQRNKEGDNCILLYSGANKSIEKAYIDEVLTNFNNGDIIVLQNEINDIPYIIEKAYERGMKIALNPSPMDETLRSVDFNKVDYLILNQIEAFQILEINDNEQQNSFECLSDMLLSRYSRLHVVLTMGSKGSLYKDSDCCCMQKCYKAKVADTTGAGDTFLGYFITMISKNVDIEKAMDTASMAAARAVEKKGAADSIPYLNEITKGVSGSESKVNN